MLGSWVGGLCPQEEMYMTSWQQDDVRSPCFSLRITNLWCGQLLQLRAICWSPLMFTFRGLLGRFCYYLLLCCTVHCICFQSQRPPRKSPCADSKLLPALWEPWHFLTRDSQARALDISLHLMQRWMWGSLRWRRFPEKWGRNALYLYDFSLLASCSPIPSWDVDRDKETRQTHRSPWSSRERLSSCPLSSDCNSPRVMSCVLTIDWHNMCRPPCLLLVYLGILSEIRHETFIFSLNKDRNLRIFCHHFKWCFMNSKGISEVLRIQR